MRAGDHLSAERRGLPWVKVEKEYVFDAPGARKRSPTSSMGGASSSFIILCSTPIGRRPASAVRSKPNTSTAPGSTSSTMTSRPSPCLARRLPSSRTTSGAWVGASIECLRMAAISTTTFAFPSRRTRSPRVASITISGRSRLTPAITARNCPASACSTRIRTGESFIPIPHTRGARRHTRRKPLSRPHAEGAERRRLPGLAATSRRVRGGCEPSRRCRFRKKRGP
jgi:Bacterial protein of unknown function (DUF899)